MTLNKDEDDVRLDKDRIGLKKVEPLGLGRVNHFAAPSYAEYENDSRAERAVSLDTKALDSTKIGNY